MDAELLVIGGGPAGLAAATGYRDHGGEGAVVLASADSAAPYYRPALSKDYLRGDADAPDELTPATAYVTKGITLLLRQSVAELDAAARTARLAGGRIVRYRSCILASGASPVTLPVPGGDDPALALLRSFDDAKALRAAALGAGRAIVVGSGFIGCEAAVSLARRGLDVTVVTAEEAPQQQRLGPDAGRRIAGWLDEAGVSLVASAEVEAVEPLGNPQARPRRVRLAGRAPLEADLVLVAVGIRPNTGFVSGTALGHARVVVDEHLHASAPGLFAAGDVAYARNAAAGRHLVVEHWDDAGAMGRIAGGGAAGADLRWDAVPGFWTDIGDHTLSYAAWGDGYASARTVEHGDGAFTIWYTDPGDRVVGVATHDADGDLDTGAGLVASGRQAP